MKYHVLIKFLAIFLCACSLFACAGSALGIIVLAEHGLYDDVTPEQLYAEQFSYKVSTYAKFLTIRYAGKTLGGCPDELLDRYMQNNFSASVNDLQDSLYYQISDIYGNTLTSNLSLDAMAQISNCYTYCVAPSYPELISHIELDLYPGLTQEATIPNSSEEFIPDTAKPAPEKSKYIYIENYFYVDSEDVSHQCEVGIVNGPEYNVTLWLTPDAISQDGDWIWQLLSLGYELRYWLVGILLGSLVLFALCAVYLCCAAGRKPNSNAVQPGGLNRLPLDIYGLCAFCILFFLAFVIFEGIFWDPYNLSWRVLQLAVFLAALLALLGCVVIVAFLFACAAQFKMPNWYFLRHSLVGRVAIFLWKRVKSAFSFLCRVAKRLWSLLPVMWQWLLTGFGLLVVLVIGISSHSPLILPAIGICIVTVVYGAYCFGTLLRRTKDMSQGDLHAKVNDRYLIGSFHEHAQNLNALADVVVDAAKKQMQSERMKAELVTNVSHDIKTPLTSIINYVDLLQKAENQAQAEEYLQVLDRQSQRLKKLIEDLMEMSKASTGNMAVELSAVDPVEAINQALGEFSEKLENAGLTPIFTAPEAPVRMQADGRLVWRVLSNLLSNAVKYAMPGTRLYIDLTVLSGTVLISLKNISREPLNASSQELLERFVRGDASRNTEGSGLGLNIAKSLMELQGGSLQLLVDGDLFKVTLFFPCS